MFGKKRRGKKGRVGAPAHEDLMRRVTADEPNCLWLTDISEHPRSEGKIYVCAVKDVWSNRIVGYPIADRMPPHDPQLAVDALESAVARRGGNVPGCTLHSDRDDQLSQLQQSLWRHQMRGSMGQVGTAGDNAGDNAAMESFFSILQGNVLLTPIEFETIMTTTADQAACRTVTESFSSPLRGCGVACLH